MLAAIENGNVEQVETLINRGEIDINKLPRNPLFVILYDWSLPIQKKEKIVKLLIDAGMRVNGVNRFGDTALLKSVILSNTKIFKMLLDAGARVNLSRDNIFTTSIFCRNPKIIRMLIEAGVDTTIPMEREFPVFSSLIALYDTTRRRSEEKLEIMKLLLKIGLRLDNVSEYLESIIRIAKQKGFPEIAELIENWPRINYLENMCKKVIYANRRIVPEWFPPLLLEL